MLTRHSTFAAAALLSLAAAPAMASSIAAFSGNTQPANGGDAATINFAVYSNSGTAGDAFGTGLANFDSLFAPGSSSSGFDASAAYLYLYQTVATNAVFENTVGVTPSKVTSFGTFTNTSFSTNVLGTAAGFGNTSSASTPATPVIVSQTGLDTPNIFDGSSSVQAFFFSYPSAELAAGHKTVLWGYTSNYAPIIGNTAIIDAAGANGQAATAGPTLVPLPDAFLTGLSTLGGLALLAKLRRPATA
ncbi:MAG: hypothetical protein ACTHN5_06200 [Phycisphaerae bacterium]